MSYLKSVLVLAVFGLLCGAPHMASAKSLPQDNPIVMTSPEVVDDVSGKEVEEKYYRFTAGPGTVTMTVDMKTDSGTMIDFDVYILDGKWKTLAKVMDVLGNSATKRAVKQIKLKKQQSLILKIVTKPSWGSGSYQVRLEGAVKLPKE